MSDQQATPEPPARDTAGVALAKIRALVGQCGNYGLPLDRGTAQMIDQAALDILNARLADLPRDEVMRVVREHGITAKELGG